MILNIKEVPAGRSVVDQKCAMTDEQTRDGGFIGVVGCHAEIERLQFQLFVKMTFDCVVRQECSRCLSVFEMPLTGIFTIVIQDTHATEGLDTDDVDYFYDDRNSIIDLRASIYDEVMTNLPIKPLCKESCQGMVLDQSEGVRKQEPSIDPRWDVLKKLKEKL